MTVWGTGKKIHRDSFDVSMKEAETAALTVVDTFYQTRDACKFEKVRDDGWNWCLANPQKCLYLKDAEDRIVENMLPLGGKVLDLFKMFMRDDIGCSTTTEQIRELSKTTEDIGEITSLILGFDLTWEQSENGDRVHLPKKVFKNKIK